MPQYEINVPGKGKYRVNSPTDLTDEQAWNAVQSQIGATPEAPKEGIMAAFTGGAKRLGSSLETGLESFINPELAAQRGAERSEKLSQQYAPGASLEKVKQAYAEKGLFPAAYEAISQIPSALAEQAPNIASTFGGARLGAMAGSAFGPVGAVVGGVGGAGLSSLAQLYGSGLERQAEEKNPEISRAKALGAAVPGAALEVASQFIPLGRTFVGKLLGPEAEKALARGTSKGVETAAKEGVMATLARGTAVGAASEIPTEVAQQMLERLQAGLPLTTPDALKEYGEAAYGAGLVGGPFGAGARALGRSGARDEYAALKIKEQADEFEQERQKFIKKREGELQQVAGTKANLGLNEKVLALPAPATKEIYEAEPASKELQNPVGNITREELPPETVKYIDKYRKDNSMPRLQTFSIEDIKDAMTAVNASGEQAALDSILAAKTGYTGNEQYTAEYIDGAA